ncbi:MAG: hypothetical protein M1470_13260 [Bacteroidetes bacterium]|nr:hypothetical protein [Bacteroidota bacterium]
MKNIFLLLVLFTCQLAFSQTDETLLDGKPLKLGDSFTKVQLLFPSPWYELFIDSTSNKVENNVTVNKKGLGGESDKIIGVLKFFNVQVHGNRCNTLGSVIVGQTVQRDWVFDDDAQTSYENFEMLYNALKANFFEETGTAGTTIRFSESSDPTSNDKEVEFDNDAGSCVMLDLTKKGNHYSSSLIDWGGDSFGYSPSDYTKEYCLTFVDYEHLFGKGDVIAQLYTSLDSAQVRGRELQLYYINREYEIVPFSIRTVLIPVHKSK